MAVSDDPEILSREQLNEMTIAEIKAEAQLRGYTVTKTIKSDIINEFLSQEETNA